MYRRRKPQNRWRNGGMCNQNHICSICHSAIGFWSKLFLWQCWLFTQIPLFFTSLSKLLDHCLAPDTSGDGTGCDNMTCVIITLQPHPASGLSEDQKKRKHQEDADATEQEKNGSDGKKVKSDWRRKDKENWPRHRELFSSSRWCTRDAFYSDLSPDLTTINSPWKKKKKKYKVLHRCFKIWWNKTISIVP